MLCRRGDRRRRGRGARASRSPSDTSWRGAPGVAVRPQGVAQEVIDGVRRARRCAVSMSSTGSMIGSSSSPPRPVRTVRVSSRSSCHPLDGIAHHFQRRRQARPEAERLGRLPQQHRQAVDHGRSTSLRRHEEVSRRGSVYRIEYDLPRRNVIGEQGRDFTLARHSQRGRVDDDALPADVALRQRGQRQPRAAGAGDSRRDERRQALRRGGRAVDDRQRASEAGEREGGGARRPSGAEDQRRFAAQRVAGDGDEGSADPFHVGVVAAEAVARPRRWCSPPRRAARRPRDRPGRG